MRDGMPTDGYTCSSCGAHCKTTDNHGEVCPADPKNKRIADLEADVEYWKQTTVDAQQTADGLRATAELVERALTAGVRIEELEEELGRALSERKEDHDTLRNYFNSLTPDTPHEIERPIGRAIAGHRILMQENATLRATAREYIEAHKLMRVRFNGAEDASAYTEAGKKLEGLLDE